MSDADELAAAPALRATLADNGTDPGQRVLFWCGGCQHAHQIVTPMWEWNGRLDLPTFSPSVLVRGGSDNVTCHSFVTDGRIQYLGDCTHDLVGQTVDLTVWPPT